MIEGAKRFCYLMFSESRSLVRASNARDNSFVEHEKPDVANRRAEEKERERRNLSPGS